MGDCRKKGVDSSYVSRMVNLTTLAPDIVVAILDENLPPDLIQFELAIDPPALLEEQRYARALKAARERDQDRERNNCSAQQLIASQRRARPARGERYRSGILSLCIPAFRSSSSAGARCHPGCGTERGRARLEELLVGRGGALC